MERNFTFSPVLQITALNNCLKANYPYPYYFRGEFHPFWEMVYAVDGTFQVASNEKVYTMQTGDVIFHKPMEFHRLWSVDGQDVHAYIIGFCGSGSLLRKLEDGAFVLNGMQRKRLEEMMTYVDGQFSCEDKYGKNYLAAMKQQAEKAVQIQGYVERLILFLLSLAQSTVQLTVKEHSDSEDSRIYRSTVQTLTEHMGGWVNAEQIAEMLHHSPTRIKRVFAKYSDIGIHKYLLKLKTAEAIKMLQNGVSCSEASRSLGFSNQNYFSTVFKRETGCPPSHYAKRSGTALPGDGI